MSDQLVKLKATLPKTEMTNGLEALQPDLVAHPERYRVAVVIFDTAKVTTDVDTGDQLPTVRVLRFEPITRGEDRKRLEALVTRAFSERTGKTVLPLDLEDELRAAFGDDN